MKPSTPILPSRTISGTKELTGIALFTALAVVLSYFSVPAPYAGFLFYEIWEIPIVIAFLMLGVRAGIIVTLVNAFVLFLVKPGYLASGPLYNLIAIFVMLLGVGVAHRIVLRTKKSIGILILAATLLGLSIRTVVMTFANYSLLPFPPPIGFSLPQSSILPLLPLIAIFNASVALYTIPVSYWVLRSVASRYKFVLAFPLSNLAKQPSNVTT